MKLHRWECIEFGSDIGSWPVRPCLEHRGEVLHS